MLWFRHLTDRSGGHGAKFTDQFRQRLCGNASFRSGKFSELKAELKRQIAKNLWLIGSDIDDKVLSIAERNAERAGVGSHIKFKSVDANNLTAAAKRQVLC